VAESLNYLADLYNAQGHFAEAEPLYRRSLVIQEKAFGLDHPRVVMFLRDLGGLYKDEGRHSDAIPWVQGSLATREKALGHDHPAPGFAEHSDVFNSLLAQ
jgi:hypothetical protein